MKFGITRLLFIWILLGHTSRQSARSFAGVVDDTSSTGRPQLTWKLKAGQEFFIKETASFRCRDRTDPADAGTAESTLVLTGARVLEIEPSGNLQIEQTILACKGRDSSGKVTSAPLDGTQFQLILDPSMEVVRLEGYDRLVKRLSNGNLEVEKAFRIENSYEETGRRLSEPFNLYLPNKPAEQGRLWTRSRNLTLGSLGKVLMQFQYSHVGQVMFQGRLVEKVLVTGAAQHSSLPHVVAGKEALNVRDIHGLVLFDSAAGRLVRIEFAWDADATLVTRALGQEVEVEEKLEMTQTIQISDERPSTDFPQDNVSAVVALRADGQSRGANEPQIGGTAYHLSSECSYKIFEGFALVDEMDGITEIDYRNVSRAGTVDVAVDRMRVRLSSGGKLRSSMDMSRDQADIFDQGEHLSMTREQNVPAVLKLLDRFKASSATIKVDPDGKELAREMKVKWDEPELFHVTRVFHPSFPKTSAEWDCATVIPMGAYGLGSGVLHYRKRKVDPQHGTLITVDVSGKLTVESARLKINRGAFMVKGQQTFDQALNEWVEGTISVSADIEVSLPPGTVKTFVGTNKLALVRTDLNQAMKSRP